jgi:acetolactate synthase-1/2/3 large subunit
MTHADEVMRWLKELGYTHCFFVAGGNSMHMLNAARSQMVCIPFVHEVSAAIAAEYFNETGAASGKSFVLVTAGPGMTNTVTALSGAFLESRELLIIGGQVKSSDLATPQMRQRGIQEIDGVSVAKPVSKIAVRIEKPIEESSFKALVNFGRAGRPGPVFIEYCLDAQGIEIPVIRERQFVQLPVTRQNLSTGWLEQVLGLMSTAQRPILLIGGGVSRSHMASLIPLIRATGIPVMTTWNAADRLGTDESFYLGRPNTWGQRSSNILIQQSDLLIAVGTRLGMQQTGFNWQQFVPKGKIIHVDIDEVELTKGHPRTDVPLCVDSFEFLSTVLSEIGSKYKDNWEKWLNHGHLVREVLPLSEVSNGRFDGYFNPYEFVLQLSNICSESDMIVPCSSGGAFTVMMQAFQQKSGQVIVTDKGLASMGYGLAGAIGTSLSRRESRTVLVEGDGGFAQNLQELATVDVQKLNLKIFIFANEGYASIRMTQKNYFDGAYLGCDTSTGLGFPDWKLLAQAFGIPALVLSEQNMLSEQLVASWNSTSPYIYVVPVHPEQSFFPKITSRVTADGSMESAPLHEMTPALPDDLQQLVRFSMP